MNANLVESLIQVIETLPPEEYVLFQEQLTTHSIQKTPGLCGGHARIRHTRIPVWRVIALQNQGANDDEILQQFPGLTLFDLAIARAYYASHIEEIDRAIANS